MPMLMTQLTYLWYALPSSSSLKRSAVSRSSILTLYNLYDKWVTLIRTTY